MAYVAIRLFHLVGLMMIFMGLTGMVIASHADFGAFHQELHRSIWILLTAGVILGTLAVYKPF